MRPHKNYSLIKTAAYCQNVKPINLMVFSVVAVTILLYFVVLPLYLRDTNLLDVATPTIVNDHQMCYANFVWNEDNKQHRFKFILDDAALEKSNGNQIFFHITNCIHDGIVSLNARQACAVESAARQNPHLNVFLTYTSQIGFLNSTRLPLIDALLTYPNIYIRNIDLVNYAEDTPAQEWVKEGKLYTSVYMQEHVADFLRLVSLYRFGGSYLDLDTVMLKNISLLGSNYAGAESPTLVANGVLNMDKNSEVGHKVAKQCLTHFIENFNPWEWGTNGPAVITSVLKQICIASEVVFDMTRENCQGFKVYGTEEFYALSYLRVSEAFDSDPAKIAEIFALFEYSTLAHMSNKMSSAYKIDIKTPVGYSQLANLYCPRVFGSLDTFF